MLQKYVSVKLIQAEPEIKDGQEGYKIIYPDGYISWCPKDIFNNNYFEPRTEFNDRDEDFFVRSVKGMFGYTVCW